MSIDVSRLPERYQRQILEKLAGKRRGPKYRNRKAERTMPNGTVRTFDSQKEARRYDELMRLYQAGTIQGLRLQQDFTLIEGYVAASGEVVRAIRYKADFVYLRDGERIVEDVKGVKTKEYSMKKKLMLDKLGIHIEEV
jgi:hypothetical protein